MNINLDGSELTIDQLLEWARTAGLDLEKLRTELAAFHNAAMQRSHLTFLTRQVRFDAFTRGELLLRTKLWESPMTSVVVNREIFDFLASKENA